LARQYGRYGYRKIAALLRHAGWLVNDKRVERIWRRAGLKVPNKQPKRGRLWLADGSCLRLRPQHKNHVWSYDFIDDRTHDGRKYRMLNVIDEFTHECLAIRIDRKLKAIDVIDVLSDLFILRGVPGHIRSDNGPEFVAKAVQGWIAAVGAKRGYHDRPAIYQIFFFDVSGYADDGGECGQKQSCKVLRIKNICLHIAGQTDLVETTRADLQGLYRFLLLHL
jgi:transposase InsO family protein